MKSRSVMQGTRVLEIAGAWAGPLCTMLLADMGAEVIKVESQARPDLSRRMGPFADGQAGLERSGYFATLCRGKKSCALDLRQPEAVGLVKQLVKNSDVVVENFSPGTLKKLGLDYDALRQIRENIIMASLSGYGATGPTRDHVAYGSVLEAITGYDRLIGYPGGPPMGPGIPISDQVSGIMGAYFVMTSLFHRANTGQGQHIDLSECETLATLLPQAIMAYTLNGEIRAAAGNRDDVMAPHGCYRCDGDDKWVAIAVSNDQEWGALCGAMGHPVWAREERFATQLDRWKNQDELDRLTESWTLTLTHYEVMHILQKAGVPAGASLNSKELDSDPHLESRGFFAEVDHPVVGKRKMVGAFAKLSGTPLVIDRAAPLLGQDNQYVFGTLLGMADADISRLVEAKVIY